MHARMSARFWPARSNPLAVRLPVDPQSGSWEWEPTPCADYDLGAMETDSWVSGGFVVARRTERSQTIPKHVFPDRLVSASERVAPILPSVPVGWLSAANAPPGRFAGSADKYMGNVLWALVSDLQRFGLPSDRACILEECLSQAEERGDFVPPSGFADLDIAQRFLHIAGRPDPDALILGLDLPADAVEEVINASRGVGFMAGLLLHRSPPQSGGEALGFEVLGLEDGELLSWADEFSEPFAQSNALAVNEHGLLSTLDVARQVAAFGNRWARRRGEEIHWSAWRLTGFPVANEDADEVLAQTGDASSDAAA